MTEYIIDRIRYLKCEYHDDKFMTLQTRSEDIDYIKLAELRN